MFYHIQFRHTNQENIFSKIWSELYFHTCPQWIKDVIKSRQKFYNLYLLLDVDVPWVNDGTRFLPHYRKEHFNIIKTYLIDNNLPFAIINGNYEERLAQAIYAIDTYVISNYL